MKAMGFVETKGLVALVAAIDVMETAANVQLVNCFANGGGRTAIVSGDVDSVRAAVEAGAWVADQMGELESIHVIANPAEGIVKAFLTQHESRNVSQDCEETSAVRA